MVLFHSLRVYRSIIKGRFDRQGIVRAYRDSMRLVAQSENDASLENPVLPLCSESRCILYMGFRMADAFGHINNSRYVEAFELARWHQMASTGLYERVKEAQMIPVVSSVNVQYLREIKPCTRVLVRTQIGPISGRNMIFHQQIESLTDRTIHATGLIRFAWLNSPNYRNADGSKGAQGPISIEEALRRAGYPERMIASYLDESTFADETSTKYYGPLACPNGECSLNETFPREVISNVNEVDGIWRGDLRRKTKAIKNGK